MGGGGGGGDFHAPIHLNFRLAHLEIKAQLPSLGSRWGQAGNGLMKVAQCEQVPH